MNWFKRKNEPQTISEDGSFTKEEEFERAWIRDHIFDDYSLYDSFNDDDYLDYKIWEDNNNKKMYSKYQPKVRVYIGKNANIIFHGGCLGCLSQRIHGIDRCKGCKYFRADWNKPNLFIEGEKAATMSQKDFDDLMG